MVVRLDRAKQAVVDTTQRVTGRVLDALGAELIRSRRPNLDESHKEVHFAISDYPIDRSQTRRT